MFLPIVEAALNRLGGVRELLRGRASGREVVGHGPHQGDIVRAILALLFAITSAWTILLDHDTVHLSDPVIVPCSCKAWPVLFLIDCRVQIGLELSDPRVDLVGNLVFKRVPFFVPIARPEPYRPPGRSNR